MLDVGSRAYGLQRVEPACFSDGLDMGVRKREESMMICSVSDWKDRVAINRSGKERAGWRAGLPYKLQVVVMHVW